MNELKIQRTQLRRTFTVSLKKLYEAVELKKYDEIEVLYSQFKDKKERLFEKDKELIAYLVKLDEREFEVETDTMEEYREDALKVEVIIKNLNKFEKLEPKAEKTSYELPQLALKKFDLNYRNWIAFYAQHKRIHEDEKIEDAVKFQYLLQSLEPQTKGWNIINTYPPSGDNYTKAMDHLERRFGRKEILIEVYMRDLLNLVIRQINGGKNLCLTELYDNLCSNLRNLETLEVTSLHYGAMLYPLVESCLPPDVLKLWERLRFKHDSDTDNVSIKSGSGEEDILKKLMKFLEVEVHSEERVLLAQSCFEFQPNPFTGQNFMCTDKVKVHTFRCVFCGGTNHNSQDCIWSQKLSLDDRKGIIFKKRCCYVCLKRRHKARECRSSVKCLVCGGRHFPIMCSAVSKNIRNYEIKRNEHPNSQNIKKGKTYLKTLLVKLCNGSKSIVTRALLDDGSQSSYSTSLAKELKLKSKRKIKGKHGLFGGVEVSSVEHQIYDVTIKNLNNSNPFKFTVLDQKNICGKIPTVHDPVLLEILHKNRIHLTDEKLNGENMMIGVLLGAPEISQLATSVTKKLPCGITAIQTKLGWTILGKFEKNSQYDSMNLDLLNHEDVLSIRNNKSFKIKTKLESKRLNNVNNITVKPENRYEIPLSWIDGISSQDYENIFSSSNKKRFANIVCKGVK